MVEKYTLIEKATKLYNLIRSDNFHESSLAKKKFDEFIAKHNLTIDQIVGNELCLYDLEKESQYEIYLFNHLLIVTIQDTPELMKKCGVIQVAEAKFQYKLTKYLLDSLLIKYEKILKVYKEDREAVKVKIDSENEKRRGRNTSNVRIYLEGLGWIDGTMMGFGEEQIKDLTFEENLFFISFIRKYELIPKPQKKEGEDQKPTELTPEQVQMIMKMEKMYRKKNVFDFELSSGRNLDSHF